MNYAISIVDDFFGWVQPETKREERFAWDVYSHKPVPLVVPIQLVWMLIICDGSHDPVPMMTMRNWSIRLVKQWLRNETSACSISPPHALLPFCFAFIFFYRKRTYRRVIHVRTCHPYLYFTTIPLVLHSPTLRYAFLIECHLPFFRIDRVWNNQFLTLKGGRCADRWRKIFILLFDRRNVVSTRTI